MKTQVMIMVATAALSGCGGGPQLGRDSPAVHVMHTLPVPSESEVVINATTYRIAPMDQLSISVLGAPELDKEGAVDAAGNFSVPLAGHIHAAGKTPEELAIAIEEKLRGRYLRQPEVSVNIKQAAGQMLTVDGEVRQPGVYPVLGKMTLQQAVATARGASETANINNVVVFRTVNGSRKAAMFSLRDIRSGRQADPQVYGNDIIVVGENAIRRTLKDFAVAFPLLGRFVPVN